MERDDNNINRINYASALCYLVFGMSVEDAILNDDDGCMMFMF